ncbi:MAG: hypothetical protein IPK26_08555 [Planctomycetes bacterium]|nr:hypothetical protein [Planctomycetota bacterium]
MTRPLPFVLLALTVVASAQQLPTLIVHGDRPGSPVPATLHGINLVANDLTDGSGLQAELLRNGELEEQPGADGIPPGWMLELDTGAKATLTRDTERPHDQTAPHALRLRIEQGAAAVVTAGHAALPLREGAAYALRLHVRRDDALPASLVASLTRSSGEVLSELELRGVPTEWRPYELRLEAPVTDPDARFAITCRGPGTLWLDSLSLCPLDTFQLRPRGLRRDLVEMLQALRPGFVRFPLTDDRTVLHAFLQLSEDLRADPVLIAAGGAESVLAAIEYARGPATTDHGGERVRAGHPEPFGLRHIELAETLAPAWQTAYPDLVTIGAQKPQASAIIAEHFEQPSDWFWDEMDHYATVARAGPKVMVGSHATKNTPGSLQAALAEAAFLCGLERASDHVVMAAGSPMVSRTGNREPGPAAILFDGLRTGGTPSYWAQVLFARHRADTLLPMTASGLERAARFTAVASRVENTGDLVLKVVNGASEAQRVRLDLSACGKLAPIGEGAVLTGGSLDATNTLESPTNVALRTFEVTGVDRVFEFEFAARSLTGLRLARLQ